MNYFVGMIPLCATSLFKKISPKKDILFLSFLEIYNEKVYDLLVPASSNFANAIIPDLAIREDAHKNILIPQMTKISIQNEEEFEKWWNIGCKNRTTAATKLNAQSSRSHSILILQLDPSAFLDCPERTKLTAAPSKLHLIDLAGSEDNRKTDNKGVRMMESTSINTSLFVLGKVVDALNQQNKDGKGNLAVRIPYRDSKLTRLLQDSLGGKSIALMIANVSPLPDHFHETFNTLTFASKSKHISNFVQMALKAVVPSPQIVENAKIQDWKFCQKRPLSELPNTGLLEASPYTNKKSKMTTNNPLRDNIFCLTEQDQLVKNEKLLSDKVEQLLMHKLQNGNGFLTPYLEKKFCQSTSLYQDHLKKSLFKANGSQASVSQLEISLEEDDMAYMKAFMTPNTRGKTARAIVQRALQLETEAGLKSPQNSLEWLEVLQNYRLAAKLLPTNEKLQKKITLLEDTLKNFEKLNKYSSPCNDGNSALESTPIVMKAASKKKKFSLDETGCSTRLSNGSTTIEPYIYPESLRPIKELSSGDLCLYTEKCLQSILNFGTKKQIMSLPGIGVKRYVKLETERNSNGYFYNVRK